MGYALIGLAAGTPRASAACWSTWSIYVFMTAGTFACIIAMRGAGRRWSRSPTSPAWRATIRRWRWRMAVFMFSLAGIPLLSGFFAKLYIFLAAVQAGLWTLAIIGVLTSVVGAFY